MKEIVCYECGFYSDNKILIEGCSKDKEGNYLCPKCGVAAFVKEIEELLEWDIALHVRVLSKLH